jgi:hypothetical protein
MDETRDAATLTKKEGAPMPETIFVDYSLVGHAHHFRTRVKAAVRRQLHAGDMVLVCGDGVAPAPARVLAVASDAAEVELELLGS